MRHFGIFCFCYPYFLVFRRENICLLFEKDISFIFILLLYQLYCKPKNIFS